MVLGITFMVNNQPSVTFLVQHSLIFQIIHYNGSYNTADSFCVSQASNSPLSFPCRTFRGLGNFACFLPGTCLNTLVFVSSVVSTLRSFDELLLVWDSGTAQSGQSFTMSNQSYRSHGTAHSHDCSLSLVGSQSLDTLLKNPVEQGLLPCAPMSIYAPSPQQLVCMQWRQCIFMLVQHVQYLI